MTDTIDKSRELFNWLKREGECWHRFDTLISGIGGNSIGCSICHAAIKAGNRTDNPNFFSPPSDKEWQWFGWLWERIQDRQQYWLDWFFKARIGDREYNQLISCTALAEALYEWFKNESN